MLPKYQMEILTLLVLALPQDHVAIRDDLAPHIKYDLDTFAQETSIMYEVNTLAEVF